MASTDSRPIPQKNVAYRVYFPVFDNDGDLVTGAAGLDSEISKDGVAFADCTNEATEIGASGMYYLDLTLTEMNADAVVLIIKTSTTNAKTTPIVLYPEEAGDIRVNVTHADGTAWGSGAITAASIAADAITDAKVAADVTIASVTGAVGSVTGAVGSVTGNVGGNVGGSVASVTTVNDKTGYALSAGGVQAIWDALTSALTTAGSIGKKLADWTIGTAQTGDSFARIGAAGAGLTALGDTRIANLDATVSSRSTYAGGAVASVTAGVTVTTNNDKTGYGLSSAAIQAIWDALTSALTTVGSVGKKLADWTIGASQTGDAFARLGAPTGVSVSADIAAAKADTAAVKAKTDNLPIDPADASDIAASFTTVNTKLDTIDDYVDTEVAAIKTVTDKVNTALVLNGAVYRYTADALSLAPTGGSAPTAAAVADAVWDEVLAGHLTAGTTGNALNAAGSAGDPWTTALPGAYGAGSAGKILGDNINATISSRAVAGDAMTLTVGERTSIATAVWVSTTRTLSSFGTLVADTAAAVWAAATRTLSAFGFTVNTNANATETAIKAKTDNLAFTTANRVDSQVFGMQADTVTAAAVATDAVAEIQTGLATAAAVTGLNNLSSAQAQSAAAAALTVYDPPTRTEATADKDELVAEVNSNQTDLTVVGTKVDELHKLQGLDIANPMTITDTSRTVGAVNLAVTGDGATTTTVTRQP